MLFGGNLVYTGQLDLVSSKDVLMLRLGWLSRILHRYELVG